MSIEPQGEHIRKAVKWIGEQRKYEPGKEPQVLVEEASRKFDLSPIEVDFLFRLIAENKIE